MREKILSVKEELTNTTKKNVIRMSQKHTLTMKNQRKRVIIVSLVLMGISKLM